MIVVKVLVLADTVIQDRSTNSMSVIRIHEQFRPGGYPLLIPRFTVFAMLERAPADPDTVRCDLRILLDDEELFHEPVDVSFGEGLINRAVLHFEGFVLPRSGALKVLFQTPDHELESYSIPAFPAGDQPVPERQA